MSRPEVHACTRAILALPFLLGAALACLFLGGAIDALPLSWWWRSGIGVGTGLAIAAAGWLGWWLAVARVQREIDTKFPPAGGMSGPTGPATERIQP